MKSFDAFGRPVQEFQVKTTCGGCVSLCAMCLVVTLFWQELNYYLEMETKDEMLVDQNQDQKHFNISLDIEFPRAPCAEHESPRSQEGERDACCTRDIQDTPLADR